jgi:hypothetical protein
MRHIGTNALPFFVHWIQYEQPKWRTSIDRVLWKLPPTFLNTRAGRWLVADRTRDRAWRAVAGFAFLGTNAAPALPELRRFAHDDSKSQTQCRADVALMFVATRPTLDEVSDVPIR